MPSGKIIEIIQQSLIFTLSFWWIYLPVFLIIVFKGMWMAYVKLKYTLALSWVLLEIQIPKEEGLGPKAAEQIFAGISGTGSRGNLLARFITGKVPDWFSFEMAGIDGEIHFFIRTLAKNRNFIESLIYAQYPSAIIQEAEDYAARIPKEVPNKNYDLFGSEMTLAKESCYPFRTYPFFEDTYSKNLVDPLSSFAEIFSKLQKGEMLGIQILVRAMDGDGIKKWKGDSEKALNKMIGKKAAPDKKGDLQDIKDRIKWETKDWARMFFKAATFQQAEPQAYPGEKAPEGVGQSLMQYLSPDEKEQAAAIGIKAAKPVLETKIRILYFGRKDIFNKMNVVAAWGAFRQFNTQNLNGYKADAKTIPDVDYILKRIRILTRKKKLVGNYIERAIAETTDILNIEELATLYHFPSILVKSPMIPRVEATRAEPPTSLPV